jgi:D-glycero-alpha-D-manno-heptose 1-phosphate guanylyltransferase
MIKPNDNGSDLPNSIFRGAGGGLREAIILAGGLGTRLRSAVPDLPKCMAPVNGRPFIAYVIDYFRQAGIEKFIFALGYKSEHFENFLGSMLPAGNFQLSVEQEPLGTGGAIRLACTRTTEQHVLVLNGDTFFGIRLDELAAAHQGHHAHCTLCLKPMQDFDRYGVVELDGDQRISSFREKQFYHSGLINGGVYALDATQFLQEGLPEKFSFEKDYLEKMYTSRRLFGLAQDDYFIDIGIPEDYERAQNTLNLPI